MAQETELKLIIDPADAPRLAAFIGRAPDRIQRFATRYFDTPDGALAAAGISLRIREADGARTQTVKQSTHAGAGLLSRGEWERNVEGSDPLLDGEDPASRLLAGRADPLEPRFTLAVTRHLWIIDQHGARVELVLDQGTITAGKAQAPVSEVEVERIDGETAALFALARRMGKEVPLRIGLWSKAQAGERLRTGAVARAAKAGKLALHPEHSARAGLALALAAGVHHYRLNEEVLLAGHDPAAIHQARVALRRLRATLALFRPLIRPAARRALKDRLRALGQALGPVRESDVLLAEQAARNSEAVRAARDKAFAQARSRLDSADARALPLDLLALAIAPEGTRRQQREQPLADCVRAGLSRLERRLRDACGPLAVMAPGPRHTLRKRAKALRYALETAAGPIDAAGGKARRRQAGDLLATIQETLGTLNDHHERPALAERLGLRLAAMPPVDQAALLAQAQNALDALLALLPILPAPTGHERAALTPAPPAP